jgi:hypothetical protein
MPPRLRVCASQRAEITLRTGESVFAAIILLFRLRAAQNNEGTSYVSLLEFATDKSPITPVGLVTPQTPPPPR